MPTGYGIYKEFFCSIFLFNLQTIDYDEGKSGKLTLHQLCDLLVENTTFLLDSIEKRADGITLRDQKRKVELLQELIIKKRKLDGTA